MARLSAASRPNATPGPTRLLPFAEECVSQSLRKVGTALAQAAKPFRGDIEAIHAVRVSTRRAAATLQFFEEGFSKKLVACFRKRLKRIRRAAGVARDADVTLELMIARGADAPVLAAIRSEQQSARKEIQHVRRKAKDGRWFKDRLRELLQSLDRRDDVSLPEWISRRWEELCHEYLAHSPKNPATIEALHRFRIQTKSLRYQLELLADRLPSRAFKKTLGLLIRVQDDLGNLIDQVTLLDLLERLEPAHPRGPQVPRRSPPFRQLQRDIDRSRKAFLKEWVTSRERELKTQLNDLITRMKVPSPSGLS